MISTEVLARRPRLGLAVIVALGLSVLSLPALAGVGEGEPGVSLRGGEAASQLQLGSQGAVPATKADAPLVVADKYKKNGNNNWTNPNYNPNKWNYNKNWNKNYSNKYWY